MEYEAGARTRRGWDATRHLSTPACSALAHQPTRIATVKALSHELVRDGLFRLLSVPSSSFRWTGAVRLSPGHQDCADKRG